MKKIACLLLGLASVTAGHAQPLQVCDFEQYEIGTQWTMWHVYGGAVTSTATVEADPENPSNKVLHVVLKEWCSHPTFVLPTDLRGAALTKRYPSLRCRLMRSNSDEHAWKQFAAFVGEQEVYRDEGYPDQGAVGVWQTRTYTLAPVTDDNQSDCLRLGIHHDNSDYYLDDIQLVGAYDDCITGEDGAVIDYCVNNTSGSYTNIADNIYIPANQSLSVRTSRYTEWTGKVMGEGRLDIYSGGERTYLGSLASKGSAWPDWSGMSGEVHLYPYKEMVGNCGFYGVIVNSGTFQPENVDASRYNSLLADKKLVVHDGATISVESGTRGIRIGELQTEVGSMLGGYYKKSSAKSYYIIGGKNTDCLLAGKIGNLADGNQVGLIKEGKGICHILGTDNRIDAGIRLLAGTLWIENDAAEVREAKKSGATGAAGTIVVYKGAVMGGIGSVAASTELYGRLMPGTDGCGIICMEDATSDAAEVCLKLHPEANIVCRVKSAEEYASLQLRGSLERNQKTQDFEDSERMPRLTIALAADARLAVGDELTLLSATRKVGDDWQLDIRYPKAYTWVVEQREGTDGSLNVVARVSALEYSGQGDVEEDEDENAGEGGYPDDDWTADMSDDTPLREYAEKLGKHIGVAAASYRYDCSLSTGPAGIVGQEFNMVVAENEMKFDATEPNQNDFNFGGCENIMSLADRNKQLVRGHTLAWHSQVPAWVSQDGKKNNHGYTRQQLLDILKNHIDRLVGQYKGRIHEWDVCNEVLDDDQSIVRTNPSAYQLRPSIWATYIGEDFIDSAFVWAHRADPEAKLYINEYGAEMMGGSKSEAYFNLIKRLQKSGIPIDGCGLQCHFTTGELDTLKLEKNIRRYAELGLNCIITELDIALANPYAADALETQAKEYGAITRVFLRNDNCPSMLVWGIADHYSWRQNQPLLFNSSLEPKPAYYNVHAQMRKAAEVTTAIHAAEADSKGGQLTKIVRYNLQGQAVSQPAGLVIEQRHYDNGRVKVEKRIYE